MARVLLVKTGSTEPALVARDGDYDDWFRAALPGGPAGCDVVAPFAGEGLPAHPERWDGILLTGSPLSVRDEAPWMAALGRWALARAEAGQPVLGVCFGHQLLGEALGGRVEANPAGREAGTVEVALTPEGQAHPLFAGLPPVLAVQATHNDALVRPPPGAVRLAGNANTAWQAFAWGPRVACVQFHPELRPESLSTLMQLRGWEGQTRPSEHGARILASWAATLGSGRP